MGLAAGEGRVVVMATVQNRYVFSRFWGFCFLDRLRYQGGDGRRDAEAQHTDPTNITRTHPWPQPCCAPRGSSPSRWPERPTTRAGSRCVAQPPKKFPRVLLARSERSGCSGGRGDAARISATPPARCQCPYIHTRKIRGRTREKFCAASRTGPVAISTALRRRARAPIWTGTAR